MKILGKLVSFVPPMFSFIPLIIIYPNLLDFQNKSRPFFSPREAVSLSRLGEVSLSRLCLAFFFYRFFSLTYFVGIEFAFDSAPSNVAVSLILLDLLYMLGKSSQPLSKESSGYLLSMLLQLNHV